MNEDLLLAVLPYAIFFVGGILLGFSLRFIARRIAYTLDSRWLGIHNDIFTGEGRGKRSPKALTRFAQSKVYASGHFFDFNRKENQIRLGKGMKIRLKAGGVYDLAEWLGNMEHYISNPARLVPYKAILCYAIINTSRGYYWNNITHILLGEVALLNNMQQAGISLELAEQFITKHFNINFADDNELLNIAAPTVEEFQMMNSIPIDMAMSLY